MCEPWIICLLLKHQEFDILINVVLAKKKNVSAFVAVLFKVDETSLFWSAKYRGRFWTIPTRMVIASVIGDCSLTNTLLLEQYFFVVEKLLIRDLFTSCRDIYHIVYRSPFQWTRRSYKIKKYYLWFCTKEKRMRRTT